MTTSTARPSLRAAAGPLAVAAGVGVVTLALHLRDPHVRGSWGVCPLYAVTGLYCPGCGGLRAVNDFTNGDFAAAFGSNALLFPAAAVMVWLWVGWLARRLGYAFPGLPRSPYLWVSVGVLVAVWTVARNFPGSPFAP